MNWLISRISFMLRGRHNPFCLIRLAFRSTKGQNGFKVQDTLTPVVETVDDCTNSIPKLPMPPPPGQIPQCVVRLGPVYMEVGGPGRWGNLLRWSKTPTHKFSCFNLIKFTWFVGWPYIRDYMNRWVTSPKRATLPTWVPPPPCKQTLRWSITPMASASKSVKWPTQQRLFKHFPTPQTVYSNINATEICLWP